MQPHPAPPALSRRQTDLLRAATAFQATHGYPASLRELAAALRITTTAAAEIVRRLELKGYVRHTPGVGRSLVVLIAPPAEVAA